METKPNPEPGAAVRPLVTVPDWVVAGSIVATRTRPTELGDWTIGGLFRVLMVELTVGNPTAFMGSVAISSLFLARKAAESVPAQACAG